MSHQVMVLEQERTSQLAKGWSLSIALHGCLILAIMVAMPKLTVTLDKEPFRWDVALVDTPSPAPAVPATAQPAQEAAPAKQAPPKQQPVRSPQPAPQIITKQVHPQESVQPITREVEPFQRETQPVQRKVETVQRDVQPVQREPQPIVEERPRQQTEPAREIVAMQNTERQDVAKPDTVIDQPVAAEAVREITPAVEQQVTQAAPVPLQTRQVPAPVTDQVMPETRPEPEVMARAPVIESPPAVPVEKPAPAERPGPAPVASPPAVPDAIESRPVQSVPSANDSPAPAVQEQAPVIARSIAPTQPKKADYGWLAESLHRRIVELRHYPSTARLNGWEGKVVLRVQIRQDGNLESVSVVKSSGHETLDNAAMEAVRRACPLHLKHELTSPMVVVQVPINYSLNR